MKKIFFAALAALLMAGCSKERETTEPTPPPTPDEAQYDVYVAAYYINDETDVSCYWKNGEQHELTLPDASVYCQRIVVADGSVYVGANGNAKIFGYWKDGVWHANTLPEETKTAWLSSIAVSEGSVYTAGNVSTSTASTPGYWKDGAWNSLPIPEKAERGSAYSIAIDGGSVYVAGDVDSGLKDTGYWKDGVWQELERPAGAQKAYTCEIACAEGDIRVGKTYRRNCKQTMLLGERRLTRTPGSGRGELLQ